MQVRLALNVPEGLKPAVAAFIFSVSGMFAQSPAVRPAFDAFEVETIKPRAPTGQAAGPFAAIQQQLGLRLEATRGPVDAFVIDRVERPSEN